MKKLPLWLHLAVRELINNGRFSLLLSLSFGLGLAGFLSVDGFQRSLKDQLSLKSKSLLGADLRISSFREITGPETKTIESFLPNKHQKAEEYAFMSMVVAGDLSRLVEVRAVQQNFPLYGDVVLERKGRISSGDLKDLEGAGAAWVYPEILSQLGVKVGSNIHIGGLAFRVTDVVTTDSTQSSIGFALAPKIFIDFKKAEQTGLLLKGSRVARNMLYRFESPEDAASLQEKISTALRAPEVKVETHETASEQMARIVRTVSDYLGLIALMALFLASAGGSYLIRDFLRRRLRSIATLISLGAEPEEARLVYGLQIMLLGLLGSLWAIALSFIFSRLLSEVLQPLLSIKIAAGFSGISLLAALLLGPFSALLFCWPLFSSMRRVSMSMLFHAGGFSEDPLPRPAFYTFLAIPVFYALLAFWQSRSLVTGSYFITAVSASAVLVAGVGSLLVFYGEKIFRSRGPWILQLCFKTLRREPAMLLVSLMTVGLGALLMQVVPQLSRLVTQQIAQPSGMDVPSLFLLDIQEEQLPGLQKIVAQNHLALEYVSPLVRGRLEEINGKTLGENYLSLRGTAERETEERLRARMYNLSSREKLAPSETLREGREFRGKFSWDSGQPVELSVEQRFAKNIGVGLGDRMLFDIQGVALEGVVVNIRSVKWSSFHPNFFVSLQPGALDDAPKIFLASLSRVDQKQKMSLQTQMVRDFPNISIIDVTAAVERILTVVEHMNRAVGFMALLCFLCGGVVLFAIVNAQTGRRSKEIALLKIMGAPLGKIVLAYGFEIFFITAVATLCGLLASLGVSYGLARLIFDADFDLDAWLLARSACVVLLISHLTGLGALLRAVRTLPIQLISGSA